MKINNLIQIQNHLYFTGQTKEFRQKYKARLEADTISQTNISNLTGLSERFSKEGLTFEKCKKAAKQNASMLVQKPQTMEFNIRDTAKRFSRFGLTVKTYLENALRYPILFSMSPQKIENNMKKIINMFAYDGLLPKDLFDCARTHPSIYSITSKSLNKKVNDLSKGLNLQRSEVIDIFKKQHGMFTLNSKEIIKKYKFLKFIEQNKYFDAGLPLPDEEELKPVILRKNFTNSLETNYKILLRNKISNNLPIGNKLPFKKIDEALKEYISNNKRKICRIEILDGEFAKEFIKFAKSYSKSIAGKNIFKFKVV